LVTALAASSSSSTDSEAASLPFLAVVAAPFFAPVFLAVVVAVEAEAGPVIFLRRIWCQRVRAMAASL